MAALAYVALVVLTAAVPLGHIANHPRLRRRPAVRPTKEQRS
ncbi:hypothetical protein ACFXGT_11540 [Streptomyces sp. NPDC059352]